MITNFDLVSIDTRPLLPLITYDHIPSVLLVFLMDISEAQKLRSSCDACGQSKTKCNRAQPQCARCASLGLSCVYSPVRQLGKRRRPLIDIGSRLTTISTSASLHTPSFENIAGEIDSTQTFNPMFDIGISASDVPLDTSPSMLWPPMDPFFRSPGHVCYPESHEVLQMLSLPKNLCVDSHPFTLDVSQILQTNKRATESLHRLLDCEDCPRKRGHQIMFYASLIARVLFWYREAAAADDAGSSNTPSVETSSESSIQPTPGHQSCFSTVTMAPMNIGAFDIDDPDLRRTFLDQLVRDGVCKTEKLIRKFVAIHSEERVIASNKMLFSVLGTWLNSDFAATIASLPDASGNQREVNS